MTERMLSPVLLLLAGLAMGFAHMHPALSPLAWLSVLALTLALRHRAADAWGAVLLFAWGAVAIWVGHPWHLGTIRNYIQSNQVLVGVLAIALTILFVAAKLLPVLAAWRFLGRFPAVTWLPASILLGEWLLNRLFPLTHTAWLVSQASSEPVLRAVGLFGWTLAAWLCLVIAVAAGEAIARRSPRGAIAPLLGLAALLLLPPVPGVTHDRLQAVGAVHMTDHAGTPREGLPGLKLLVWPEQASKHRPWLSEGPGNGQRIDLPLRVPGTSHLYGLVTRQEKSIQNSLLALEPEGSVRWVRAKARLFPVSERPVLGVCFMEAFPPLRPGQGSARTEIAGYQAVSVVCLEGLERDFLWREVRDETELVTVSASDKSLVRSPLAMRQIVGVTALVAADLGLPIVRASVFGQAAIIDRTGKVLAVSEPGTSGILALRP
jgi:apolipoprotein N-acyltransferase